MPNHLTKDPSKISNHFPSPLENACTFTKGSKEISKTFQPHYKIPYKSKPLCLCHNHFSRNLCSRYHANFQTLSKGLGISKTFQPLCLYHNHFSKEFVSVSTSPITRQWLDKKGRRTNFSPKFFHVCLPFFSQSYLRTTLTSRGHKTFPNTFLFL